jgi:predicted CXXCH cytochrome family protein
VERRCGECHGEQARYGIFTAGFSKLDASVCLKCHGGVLEEHPLLHGPVAAGACLWCHQPHESPQPSLLVSATPALCLQCHHFQLLEAPAVPHHQDLDRDCLDCHLGHGGAQRYFLRDLEATSSTDLLEGLAVRERVVR